MKKPTRIAAWAGLAAALAPLVVAQAAPQPYRLAAPSGWVGVASELPLAARPVEEGESDYLLVEHQVRLSSITEHYSRLVERLVSQDSVDRGAQISIDIDPVHERVVLHEVRVFRNGRFFDKLRGARRSLLNREEQLDRGLINGRVTLHVLLEDIRVGDVLDYSYTRERKDPFGERGYNDWFTTQFSSPVRRYRLRVLHLADRPLQILDYGKLGNPVTVQDGQWIEKTWTGKELAALTGDDHRPGWFYFYPRIEISEFADWNAVRAWSQPMYEVKPVNDTSLSELIAELKTEPKEGAQLLRALRFVQDDIRYTGLEIGAGAYRPSQPSTVLARRYGDCKDKVLLLVTLLRALGVEAYPALVDSNTGRGVAQRVPSPGAFDHVVAKVRWKDRDYWLDATASGQGGDLDTLVQADFGLALVLDMKSKALTPMPARRAKQPLHSVVETFDLRKGRDATASFTVLTQYREAEADSMRAKMRSTTATALGKDYLDYYRKEHAGIRLVKPLVVKDDRERNLVSVEENYEIDEPFRKNDDGEWKFHLEAYLITEHAGNPNRAERSAPLVRAFPMHVQQTIVAYLPHDWNVDEDVVKITDSAFQYRSAVKFRDRRLQLDYDLRNTADHVSADRFRQFAQKLEKVRDDAYFTLTDAEILTLAANATATGTIVTGPNLEAIVTILLGVSSGGVVAFGLSRVRRRLPAGRTDAPAGFGGWLNLLAIFVLLLPVLLFNNVRFWLETFGLAAEFQRIGDSIQWLVLVELLLQCVLLLPSAVAAWLMVKRRHAFPFAFIAVLGLIVPVTVNSYFLWTQSAEALLSPAYGLIGLSAAIAVCGVAAAYVMRSQRVRTTFLDPAPIAD